MRAREREREIKSEREREREHTILVQNHIYSGLNPFTLNGAVKHGKNHMNTSAQEDKII